MYNKNPYPLWPYSQPQFHDDLHSITSKSDTQNGPISAAGNSSKAVYTKPASCECTLINDYYNMYRLSHRYASFADYLKRTQGITLSNTDLALLRELCNNPTVPGEGGACCVSLLQPILLPPSLQCSTGPVCVSCTIVDTVEKDQSTDVVHHRSAERDRYAKKRNANAKAGNNPVESIYTK